MLTYLFLTTLSQKSVKDSLDNVKEDIVIRLNSGGGDVFEGIEIYNYLKSLSNHITIEVTALGEVRIISCNGGDKIIIRTGANMMVHEASTMALVTNQIFKNIECFNCN